MFKKILTTLFVLTITTTCAYAATYHQTMAPAVAQGIRYYKSGNNTACIQTLENYVKTPSGKNNQLATYYLGMAYTKIGRPNYAKHYYNTTKSLNPNNTIGQYADKGIVCIDNPSQCYVNIKEVKKQEELSDLDKFVRAPYGNGLSSDLNKELERRRVERLRREMNSDEELNRFEFEKYRDFTYNAKNKKSEAVDKLKNSFEKAKNKVAELNTDKSSTNTVKIASNSQPTDAEVLQAIKVLNAAGLNNIAKQAEINQANTQNQTQQTTEQQAKTQTTPEVKSAYKPDVTREEYQKQMQQEMLQAQMATMSQPNIDALFGNNNNNGNNNNMMNNQMMNMLPFMMAQQAQNGNAQNISPEMMQTMMLNSMMPNMNFGLGNNN